MRQLAIVAATIAGLIVCPGACWMHALGDGVETAADRATGGGCGCCCDGPARSTPEKPQSERPSGDSGASCICKGGTVASKSDAPKVFDDASPCWVATVDAELPAVAADRATDLFDPLAHASPTGRALRVLLQSLLA